MSDQETDGWSVGPVGGSAPPRKAAPKQQNPADSESDYSVGTFGTNDQVDTGEDVARSALAKGVRGAAALPGMFGDVPAMFGAEKYRPPTTEEYIEKISNISPKVREMLAYQPKTTAGRYVGSAAEFLPSAALALIPGGQGPALSRLGVGAVGAIGSGIGSQAVEDLVRTGAPELEGTPYEAAGKFAGAVAGGAGLPSAVRGIGTLFQGAGTRAAKDVASALSKDFTRGTSVGAPADVARSEIPLSALGGQETANILKSAAGKAGDAAIGQYNDALKAFRENSVNKVTSSLEQLFGGEAIDMSSARKALDSRIRQTNDANYSRVMDLPHAKSINDPALDHIASIVPQSIVDDVTQGIRYRSKGPMDGPESFGFIPVQNKAGEVTGYKLPAQGLSLRGWDEIKQGIDSSIGKMYDPVTKKVKPGYDPSDLNSFKNQLVGVLDKNVPEYGPIRFEGAQLYDSRNAMEAGYRYFQDGKAKGIQAKEDMVRKLTGPQKEDFAYGYSAALQDEIAKDPLKALGAFNKGQGDFNFNKMKFALGEDNAHQIIGDIHAGYLGNSLKNLDKQSNLLGQAGAFAGSSALGAIGSQMLGLGETLATGSAMSFAPSAIAGLVLGGIGKGIYSARERAKADEILRLMADPNARVKLGKMIADDPDARSFMQKLYMSMARNAPPVAAQTNQPSPQEANGGRIGRASGGRIAPDSKADSLVRAAEVAKKDINKSTEPLLDQPDETITRALAVAKKHI
jgi:hypothetical protein